MAEYIRNLRAYMQGPLLEVLALAQLQDSEGLRYRLAPINNVMEFTLWYDLMARTRSIQGCVDRVGPMFQIRIPLSASGPQGARSREPVPAWPSSWFKLFVGEKQRAKERRA